MPYGKTTILERLAARLDELDPSNVQAYILRLLREKGFFETVFDAIREGIMVIDHERVIRFANEACRELLGLPENIAGRRIDQFLRDIDWSRVMNADSGEWHRVSLQEIEVFYPIHRFISFYLVPLPQEEETGGLSLAAMILRDVTEARERTERTIESRQLEAITALAAAVAHEIGNPLNSLTIHLQLLQRKLRKSGDSQLVEETRELLDVALQEVRRLDSIIHNFLRAVRPTPPQVESVSVAEILTESLDFMKREIEDRNILVQVSLAENLPRIMADPGQLKQAFFNIVKNAIQAMVGGGVLRVQCIREEDSLVIRFADTGKGIPPEQMTRILEPYYTTREDGTGLGLVVVERIVRNHGGELAIESEPGTGTVVSIRFPLRARSVRLLQAPRNTPEAANAPDREREPMDS